MRRWSLCLTGVLIFVLWAGPGKCKEIQERKVYRVTHVIDGDTLVLNTREHVRLIGIDAPEIQQNAKFERDLQRRHLGRKEALEMGRKSHRFVKDLVEGKQVRLEFDVKKYDDYHRILAYVYLLNGQFVNAQIVKAGYAYAYKIKPDLRYASLFNQLYNEACQYHRGLWKKERKYEKGFKWFDDT